MAVECSSILSSELSVQLLGMLAMQLGVVSIISSLEPSPRHGHFSSVLKIGSRASQAVVILSRHLWSGAIQLRVSPEASQVNRPEGNSVRPKVNSMRDRLISSISVTDS